MVYACRICGRADFAIRQARGRHEASHVARGEAKWTTPKIRGDSRGIEPTDNYHPSSTMSESAELAQAAQSFEDSAGRVHAGYNGTPCEICGATTKNGKPFHNSLAFMSHKNWHVRRKEAKWVGHGKNKHIVQTKLGLDHFGPQAATPNGQELAIAAPTEQAPTVIEIQADDEPSDNSPAILKTITNALLVVQIASAVQDMDPADAMAMISGMKRTSQHLRRR